MIESTTLKYEYGEYECGYRLPCGICRLTNITCPRQSKPYVATCGTEVTTK